MKKLFVGILKIIVFFAAVFLCAGLITRYVGHRVVVDGQSMESTLFDGDSLLMDKLSYTFGEPKRFDIVVFNYDEGAKVYYIKRVIGLPGETVYIDENGIIYIDGEVLPESYGREVIKNPGRAGEIITLGPEEYFCLGDNRNNSSDSRMEDVGNIKRTDIRGKAWFRLFPFERVGIIR